MTRRHSSAGPPEERPDSGMWGEHGLLSRSRYRRMLFTVVIAVATVALAPLGVMSVITYRQYQDAFRAELTRPMFRFAEAGSQSLDAFLSERQLALAMVVRETPPEQLIEPGRLDTLLASMKQTFGGLVDLGFINEEGIQTAYAGPYELTGRDYAGHAWFQGAANRGSHVSDVFLGYRGLPHIAVAIRGHTDTGGWFVLRATIDTDVFHWLLRDRASRRPEQGSFCSRCHSLAVPPFSDAFIINEARQLQTPSQLYGAVLDTAGIPDLRSMPGTGLLETTDARGQDVAIAYAAIARSPFILVLVSPRDALHAGWLTLRRDLIVFPAASALLILAVVFTGTLYLVNRTRESDRKRAALFHKMEYANKLAAIGRLGAGVAHEINNPLSIIMQKAGLLRDLLTMSDEPPPRDKIIELTDSVLRSAERCGGITHRLLGFAKHMDVQRENIDLDVLLREVVSFLEKEAEYRQIRIDFVHDDDPPMVVGDRGQLQQVFLNIINNAFAAVEDGGHVQIEIRRADRDRIAVSVEDDGVGIPEDQLQQIFDPFFTTKKGAGTGLGLSITYGIVQKLGGEVSVWSRVGEGTRFTVTLPIGKPASP